MNITINAIQLATELAHKAAFDEMHSDTSKGDGLINDEDEMWTDGDENTMVYTEEAQEVFERWYIHFLDAIIRCKTTDRPDDEETFSDADPGL